METLTREAEIRAKGAEWVEATLASLHAQEIAISAQLEHKKYRQRVLQVEDEMRGIKENVMSLVAHKAMA